MTARRAVSMTMRAWSLGSHPVGGRLFVRMNQRPLLAVLRRRSNGRNWVTFRRRTVSALASPQCNFGKLLIAAMRENKDEHHVIHCPPFLAGGGAATQLIVERDWSSHPLGAPAGWPTELKVALSMILNSPESMILAWGEEELTFFFNETYFPLLGPRLSWAMGAPFKEVWADAWEQAKPIIDDAFAGRSQRFNDLPWKLDTDRGLADTWFTFSYSRVLDGDGEIAGLLIFTNETTARVMADAALRESQERLRSLNETLEERVAQRTAERDMLNRLVELADVMVMAVDLDYNILALNTANADEFERIFGVRPVAGDNMLALLDDQPEHREQVRIGWGQGMRNENVTMVEDFGDRLRDRPYYEVNFRPLRDDAGKQIGVFQFVTDVTERLRREAELADARDALRQAQKMEAMGQLTGGVAHDFNNLLTPIVGSLDLLRRKQIGGEREQRLIDGAAQSAERARVLVQRLLAFARRQPLQPAPVDIAGLIEGMNELVASTVGPRVKVAFDLDEGLPAAEADPNQLEMALLNLAVNARDAMPDGGALRIKAGLETVWLGHRSGLPVGRYLCISVADDGIGMDTATVARAVEPFFSTKGVGKGTGLGLSMVHGLASQLGGALTIESQPASGTTIELWLPESASVVEHMPTAPIRTPDKVANQTVLLVDDEELVRASTADMLAELGYQVIEVESGEKALRLVEEGMHFDLLVTDHLMPGMTGIQLVDRVRSKLGDVPVLLVSGYAEQEGIGTDLPRLTKPFRKDELAATLP